MVSLGEEQEEQPTSEKKKKNYVNKVEHLLKYYSTSKDVDFTVDFRPLLKKQNNGELWNRHPNRLWPDDLWTGFKKVLLDARELHDLHSHPDIRKARKAPEIYNISLQSTFFIGMDTTKHKPVVTDRNPNLEGLVDIHQCVYLPSAYEKQSFNLPDNLPQKVTFIELPDAPIHTPGIAPGIFFITPKLIGCNIFVAHDEGLHKDWIIRVSVKANHTSTRGTANKASELSLLQHQNEPVEQKPAEDEEIEKEKKKEEKKKKMAELSKPKNKKTEEDENSWWTPPPSGLHDN